MTERRTVYLAYGSNLNISQMIWRCPTAKPIRATILANWELTFWGDYGSAVATIIPRTGSSVPVALWSITAADEQALDVYEGFPRLYRKQYLWLKCDDRKVKVMVYIMNNGYVNVPSESYFATILDGYRDFSMNPEPLFLALKKAQENRSSM